MGLSWLLTTASLIILAYAGFVWLRGQLPRRESSPTKLRMRAFKKRSQGSNVQNPVNVGSSVQEAKPEPVNVQVNPERSDELAPPATPPGDNYTLSRREMVQLGEALSLYREGANVEQAVSRGFGVTKGGSEGWKRAKALFDAATALPGAAPAGTYAAPEAPRRRRRVERSMAK